MSSGNLLGDLVRTMIAPGIAPVDGASSGPGWISKQLSAVEGYGWILLGVRIGAIPQELALRFVTHSSEPLRRCLDFAQSSEAGSAFDSGTLGEMSNLLATKQYVSTPETGYESLPFLPMAFSIWYAEVKRFAQSPEASNFISLANFTKQLEWPRAIIDREAIARRAYSYWQARASSEGSDVEDWLRAEREIQALGLEKTDADPLMYTGYANTLQHMDSMALLLDNDDINPAYWPVWGTVRNEIGRLNHWRLNFTNNAVFSERFDQITKWCDGRFVSEAAAAAVWIKAGAFSGAVDELKKRYIGAFGQLYRAAGAGD